MTIDVACVLYFHEASTLQAIAHLLAYTPAQLRFILVDNGGEWEPLTRWLGKDLCTLIHNEDNVGCYVGFNQALAEAKSPYVILAAPDHYVLPRWFDVLPGMIQNRDFAWVSPEWTTGPYHPQMAWDALSAEPHLIEQGRVSTSCALIHWNRLQREVGVFDERFFLTHGDSDYIERMRDAGLPFGTILGAKSHHAEHGCRKRNSPEEDTRLELQDEERFHEKWAARPDVLERHGKMAPIAGQLTARKAAMWTA